MNGILAIPQKKPLTGIHQWYISFAVTTAKIFPNGRSQAVRLPKEFRFDCDEVYVGRLGSAVVLMPKRGSWDVLFDAVDGFTEDFMEKRGQPAERQKRELDF